jgi:hypothetical protein
VQSRSDLPSLAALAELPVRRAPSLRRRQRAFDAAAYDRMRVLLTELRRIFDEGGEIALRVGRRTLEGETLARLIRTL